MPQRTAIVLRVDRRELATILAALRFHQDENLQGEDTIADCAIRDIASDGGTLKPLSFAEIDRLCRRLNITAGPPHRSKHATQERCRRLHHP